MIHFVSILTATMLTAASAVPNAVAGPATETVEPAVVTVTLDNFRFRPDRIRLVAGQPTILRLVDRRGRHSFSAPEFFATAMIDPKDRSAIDRGKVELASGGRRDILLTAVRGEYRVKCSHTLHAAMGMSGLIDVE